MMIFLLEIDDLPHMMHTDDQRIIFLFPTGGPTQEWEHLWRRAKSRLQVQQMADWDTYRNRMVPVAYEETCRLQRKHM